MSHFASWMIVLETVLNWAHLKRYTVQNSYASEADLYNEQNKIATSTLVSHFFSQNIIVKLEPTYFVASIDNQT